MLFRRVIAALLACILLTATTSAEPKNPAKSPREKKPNARVSGPPSPRFDVLSPNETAGWAKVLDKFFAGIHITAEEEEKPATADGAAAQNAKPDEKKKSAGKKASSGKEVSSEKKNKDKSPTGRLCISTNTSTTTGPCPTVPALDANGKEEFSALEQIIGVLDTNNFKGVTPDASYIIQTSPSNPAANANLKLFWVAIQQFLSRPSQGLTMVWPTDAYNRFLVLQPRIGAKSSQVKTAALIKQDLQALGETYRNWLSAPDAGNGVVCNTKPESVECKNAIIAMERWTTRNTVALSYLSPRDVALALWDLNKVEVRVYDSAVTFLPKADLSADAAYLAADAIQRQVLHVRLSRRIVSEDDPPSDDGAPSGQHKDGQGKDAQTAEHSKQDKGGGLDLAAEHPIEFDNFVRLFHLRRAKDIAGALNQAAPKEKPLVTTLENNPQDDVLVITPFAGEHAMDIKRAIAILDQPRPQLSLQVWHYQLSTKNRKSEKPIWAVREPDAKKLQERFDNFRDAVKEANDRMTAALERGYDAAVDYAQENTKPDARYSAVINEGFADYLTGKYEECVTKNKYCLGYYDALDATKSQGAKGERMVGASLSRLVLLLAASKDENASALVQRISQAMDEPQSKQACYTINKGSVCLIFSHFKDQLEVLSTSRNLHAVQAALLDFLFQYKWTVAYPNDFVPYDLQRTAHTLDDLLQPLTEAFNRDLDFYLERVFKAENSDANGLLNRGQIQVGDLSGSAASVQGAVKNYFDITPPLSLNDILNTSNQSNLASALQGVLQPKEITVLQALANVGNAPRITAELSENASLKITPISLDTASSAELDVDFDVGEPTAPVTSGVSSPPKDLLDRVADHHVTTHVRVQSVKLFQISSFTMTLTHPQRGTLIPVIGWGWEAIFGTTPYVGNLFRLPPYSETVDNRSMAIVRAVVVPTAMDIGLGLRFEADRVSDPVAGTTALLTSVGDAGGKFRPFHKKMMQYISTGTDCSQVTLSSVQEDLRMPSSH